MRVHQLTMRYQELMSLLEEGDDESLQEAVDNALADLHEDIEGHADQLGKVMANLEHFNNSTKSEIARLKSLMEYRAKRHSMIKEALRKVMLATDTRRVDTALFSFSIRKGSKSVDIVDESKLSEEYLKVEVVSKPIKSEIKKGIESGLIPEDVAKIVTGEPSLQIK